MTIKFNTFQLKDRRVHFNKSFKFSGRILAFHLGGWGSLPSQWSTLCVWTSLVSQLVKNPPATQETPVQFLGWKIRWRRDRLPAPMFLGFSGGSDGKESACNMGDLGSIPKLGRSPEGGHGNPFQYSCLENPHGLQFMGSQRVGHDWTTNTFTFFQLCIKIILNNVNAEQEWGLVDNIEGVS